MAFQELEWHATNGVEFDAEEGGFPEVIYKRGAPELNDIGMEPVWTSD